MFQIRNTTVAEINFFSGGLKGCTVLSETFYRNCCLLDFLSESSRVHAQRAPNTAGNSSHQFHTAESMVNGIFDQVKQAAAGHDGGGCVIKAPSAEIGTYIKDDPRPAFIRNQQIRA